MQCRITFCLALILCALPVRAQLDLPRGLTRTTVASGFTAPIAFDFIPDGRILVAEQFTGNILQTTPQGTVNLVGTIPNLRIGGATQGLLSIAVDPAYPVRPYLYAWFSAQGGPFIHLSMYTLTDVAGVLSLGSEYVILDDVPDNDPMHNGGALRFGPDGMLYISVGDDHDSCAALDPNVLSGSILRLDVSALPQAGSGPPPKTLLTPSDNPFLTMTPEAGLVWATGLRNPFRFQIDPIAGDLFVTDVGENTWEEVNLVSGGGVNLGWPINEGPDPFNPNCANPTTPAVLPILSVLHPNALALMAFGLYREPASHSRSSLGPEYDGEFFFADFYHGDVQRLRYDGTQWLTPPPVAEQPSPLVWGSAFFGATDARFGPDGSLYYLGYSLPGFLARVAAATAYPGNGSDVAIAVMRNGTPDDRDDRIHRVHPGDQVQLRCLSPGGARDFQPFVLTAELIPTGSPPPVTVVTGDPAPSIWIDSAAQVLLNGFTSPGAVLWPAGFGLPTVTIPPWLAGSGFSFLFQAFVSDPGRNAFDLGVSDAVELRVL